MRWGWAVADTLALEHLFDKVDARFRQEGAGEINVFAWGTSKQLQGTSSRIVWTPGDAGGGVGTVAPARFPGRNPRPIATLQELFTVTLSATDATEPESARAQYKATRLLYDAWVRAVYLAAHGTFRIASQSWVAPERKQRKHGAAIRVVCTIDAMIPDVEIEGAPTDTGAEIDVEQHDVTEVLTVAAP